MSDADIINQALSILENRLKEPQQTLTSTNEVRDFLKLQFNQMEHESFRVMFLNTQHRLIALEELSRGTIDEAAVYPREVVKAALKFNAAAVVLAHNHPSGLTDPSEADRKITQRLKDALALVDIRVLDHFIIADNETYSFAEHGMI